MRWLLYEQAERAIHMPLLVVGVSWLAIMFISVGLYAPPNITVIVALMLAAMSVAGAIFLILELDMPLTGSLRISSAPMRNAREHLASERIERACKAPCHGSSGP
jgi:nitric oxide reductase large subunit